MVAAVAMDGRRLTPAEVVAVARDRATVSITDDARDRIAAGADVVAGHAAAGIPVYGVTTGLGQKVVEGVAPDEAHEYSLRTLRGRATAVGEPLAGEVVRAAMAVRLSGLCSGGAGAGPAIADGLVALLNAGVHPTVPGSGSVGASDLCLMAHIGLALIGEGEVELEGMTMPAAQALARRGLEPVALGPKDGLAICSSSAVSAGAAALSLADAGACLSVMQVAAALSMEGFRANLSPLDPRVVAARPAPGQAWAAQGLRLLLSGGDLEQPGAARRVQDPLSFRCVSQIHGSLRVALDLLDAALAPELGGAADNPLVLLDGGEILSTGNFHVPALALALDATAIALAQVAGAAAQRQARLKTGRLSGLPHNLVAASATRSGFGPLSKTAEALVVEIRHRAAPYAVHSTVSADSVEDDSTSAAQGALRVAEQVSRMFLLAAVELVVAAQAVELAAPGRVGAGAGEALRVVRESVDPLEEDRPLGPDVQRLAREALVGGELLRRVGTVSSAPGA